MKKQNTYLHGEVQISTIKELPKEAKKMNLKVGETLKLAESETTGNHHLLDVADGVDVYELDGKWYLKNSKPANVRCVIPTRHDDMKIDPGIHEVLITQEWDYLSNAARNVAD